ncbi:hypothetical protein LSCM1_00821 [Leishmania martiniquensis]|uniref:Uncharacterized protein n=1 Tax=Leishmania martiniquensis TaxID=1580590 RepID=A0A836GFP0_9TRYP|nr:hypothetical protein LSCM1_00821 [Leishmania martiniquensis]
MCTSLAASPGAAVGSSDVRASYTGAYVPAGSSKFASVRPRAVAAIPLNCTVPPPSTARESVPSLHLPAAAAAVHDASPLGSSSATTKGGAARRPRGSIGTASVADPPAAVDVPGASTAGGKECSKATLSTSLAAPQPPPNAELASDHADVSSNLTAVPTAVAAPHTGKPHTSGSAPARGPRRLSATSHNATNGVTRVPGAVATPSRTSPAATAAHADPVGAPAARQRISTPSAITSKQNGQSAVYTTALGASSWKVTQASLKSSLTTKKTVIRRAGAGAATSRPQSTVVSRRSSLSCTTTADNATASTRDPSVLLPQPRSSGGVAPTFGAESVPSTALNTARTSGPPDGSTPASVGGAVSSSTTTRISRGPVVSEEWARSIIKPGDEKLLYQAATAAETESGFTRTPSSMSMSGAMRSTAWQAHTVRSSKSDTQLRHAQETVLRQRYAKTPAPGWRSAKAASVDAGSAASVASGGSTSRFGSTIKRSGTRLQHRLEEGEGRQAFFTAAAAAAAETPTSENGGSVGGGYASNRGIARGSTSPTPSHLSEASFNRVRRGGSRLGGGGVRSRLEHPFGSTPIPMGHLGERSSASLTLFAKPSPRTFLTPSPRGGLRELELKTSFDVRSGQDYVGSDELTRLTSVREEMLLTLMNSARRPAAAAAAAGESTSAATVSSTPNPKDGSNADVLEGSASSQLAMRVGQQADERVLVRPAAPSPGTQARQRVYSVDLRSGFTNDTTNASLQSPAADAAQPRWRSAVGGTVPLLASSIRQKPGSAAFRALAEPLGAVAGAGPTSGPPCARPTLDSIVLASDAFSKATRQPRRPGVMVKLSNLQSPSVVAERVRLELVRQEQRQLTAACTGQTRAAAPSTAATAGQPLTVTSMEVEARRLLLDPLFPLISEENYQRLVLQNSEYKARKELLASIHATPMTAATLLRPCESPPPVPPLDVGEAPRAARALEMDLAEADEPASTLALTAAALAEAPAAAVTVPLSLSVAMASNTPPRRPSVQYGGPALCATFSPPRAPSPSPTASNLTSPTAGPVTGLGSSTAFPARDGKLHVNAVMTTEKLTSIKTLAAGGVWHAAFESTAPSTAQPFLNASLLASAVGGAAVGGPGSSPIRLRSTSPTASGASSRNVTRRSSMLRSAQQHLQLEATATVTSSSSRSSSTDDQDSTASDEAVELAEGELFKALQHWGPFRTPHATAMSTIHAVGPKCASQSGRSAAGTSASRATIRRASKTDKLTHGETAAGLSSTGSTPSLLSMAPAFPSAMAEELRAYMHVFLKRYRGIDAAVAKEMGPVPKTPLALQRAIRRSLRLSNGRGVSAADDEEAVELEDPLDDGSYHSQNVQYVLDLVGSLLQAETSFCEDDAEREGRGAHPPAALAKQHKKQRVAGAELIALVMGRPTSSEGESVVDGTAPNRFRNASCSSATPRPIVKLRDPELRAVELMFVNDAL